jgi:glycosyltransferase involved in cell wall biosynthesis
MKILYVSDAASVHTRRWAEAFRDRGAEVHVASFRPAEIPGVTVHRLATAGLGKLGYLLALPQLRALAMRLRPDVVHAQYLTSYGFLAAAARLRPLVVTAWGSDALVSPRESRLARALVGHALRRADRVTAVAEHMLPTVHALGADPARTQAFGFGVDTALFRLPEHPPAEPPPLRLICTRNFGPIYSVHTVVEAARQLQVEGHDLRLDLVGQGPLRADLEAQVAAAGLAERTTFHGHVDHPTLVGLLQRAHLFVSPALSDGNNVSLNEAMACGAYPVATAIPANAQWLVPGENGHLVPPGDAAALAAALREAAADPLLRAQAARRNRAIVEARADWSRNVQRMAQLYADVVAERRGDAIHPAPGGRA